MPIHQRRAARATLTNQAKQLGLRGFQNCVVDGLPCTGFSKLQRETAADGRQYVVMCANTQDGVPERRTQQETATCTRKKARDF